MALLRPAVSGSQAARRLWAAAANPAQAREGFHTEGPGARTTRQGVGLLRRADESGGCCEAHRPLRALEHHAGGGGVRDDRRSARTPRSADRVRPLGGGATALE